MDEPLTLQPGDPCPNCLGELKPAPVPTDAQRARMGDKENPITLDRRYDSATAAQRASLGALYRCASCPYETRFTDAQLEAKARWDAEQAAGAAAAAAAKAEADAGEADGDAAADADADVAKPAAAGAAKKKAK